MYMLYALEFLIEGLKMRRRAMSDLVTRLRVQVSALQSGYFLVGLALDPEGAALIKDLTEAADRIEQLERARLPAGRRPDPTPDKINEAFKRATTC
jgi:hypothetical protein